METMEINLIEAIRNVVRPEPRNSWDYAVGDDDIMMELGISGLLWGFPDELDERLKAYPLAQWQCTDTWVGLSAIYLDGEPVGYQYQSARKSSRQYGWISEELALRTRDVIMSYAEKPTLTIIAPDETTSIMFKVSFTEQLLTDEGFYNGRPCRVLIRYGGYSSTTPKNLRTPGRSYFVNAPYGTENYEKLMIEQDGKEFTIPVEEFKMPLNVKMVDQ